MMNEVCPYGCIFVCPCEGGCNGCEKPPSEWVLLGDCRMPESDECLMNDRTALRVYGKERDG